MLTFLKVLVLAIQLSSHVLKVAKGATVEYAIVDKGVEIAEGVTVRGTENNPVVIKKVAL